MDGYSDFVGYLEEPNDQVSSRATNWPRFQW